jgi:hypothetical protein
VPDVHEAPPIEVAEQERAEVLARVARLGEAADDELLAKLDLELEPVPGTAAGLVGGVGPLGNDPLPSGRARTLEHLGAVTGDRLSKPQLLRGAVA